MTDEADWVAVDWGTSNLRAWGIGPDGAIAFSRESDQGMGKLTQEAYPGVLNALLDGAVEARGEPVDVLICGMAGARQGWLEAPYRETPADLMGIAAGAVRPVLPDSPYAPRILPGVCQRQDGSEDVMRGEETQLLGLLSLRPGFSGTAIMPGTHSKWVRIEGGKLVRFATAMTGELYDVLGTHTVLRHSLAGERMGPATEDGVSAGLEAGLAHPELLSGLLFRTRAAALLSGKGADWCSGYLSGLLVGAEIGGHRDWLRPETTVPLIGSARLARLYGAALSRIGIRSQAVDSTEATIAGLVAARSQSSQ